MRSLEGLEWIIILYALEFHSLLHYAGRFPFVHVRFTTKGVDRILDLSSEGCISMDNFTIHREEYDAYDLEIIHCKSI